MLTVPIEDEKPKAKRGIEVKYEIPKVQFVNPDEAQAAGFKSFNNVPTLCVDVPDGASTISAKLRNGEVITFAFVNYVPGAAPACVDIQAGQADEPQEVIAFTKGSTAFRSKAEAPVSLLTVVLGDGANAKPKLKNAVLGGAK